VFTTLTLAPHTKSIWEMFDINNAMSNVIQFPVQRTVEKAAAEKKAEMLYQKKCLYAEKQTQHYGEKILYSLHKQGFDVDSEEFLEDFIFVMESFKSCLLRNLGVAHPLQKIQHKLHEMLEENDS